MNFVAVKSSNLVAIAHDPIANELRIRFKNGGEYLYHGIDAGQHAELMEAHSIGSHLHDVIKRAASGVQKVIRAEDYDPFSEIS